MHSIELRTPSALDVTLTGDIDIYDYESVVPRLESLLAATDEVGVVFDVRSVERLRPSVIWEDVRFDMRRHGERVAIVGSPEWREWAKRLFRIQDDSIRQFDELAAAQRWVTSHVGKAE